MTTRSDLETELLARLQVATNSTLYPSARLTTLIQNAYIWATQLFIWHDLVRAMTTGTKVDHEYYDYPAEFRSESILQMEIDGDWYGRKNYEDYLDYRRDNPSTTKKMFASFGRRFFVNPTPTTLGSANISIWGAIQADALSLSSSVPIFSYNKEEGNEATIRKAFSVAVKRQDSNLSTSEENEAKAVLAKLSFDEQTNTQRNQRLNHPMLNVPDFFVGKGRTPYSRFNYQPEVSI